MVIDRLTALEPLSIRTCGDSRRHIHVCTDMFIVELVQTSEIYFSSCIDLVTVALNLETFDTSVPTLTTDDRFIVPVV